MSDDNKQMIMDEIVLGTKVKIIATKKVGSIVGVWGILHSPNRYCVRYYDSAKKRNEDWFGIDELEVI